jgi:hypothetical protein
MNKLQGDGLSPELCFEPDGHDGGPESPPNPPTIGHAPRGHLTDAALACIADGEVTIVPAAALAHVEDCEACGRRLGAAALLSVGVTEALIRLDEEPRTVSAIVRVSAPVPSAPARKARRPLPVAAILVASFVALVTAGPAIADAIGAAPSLIAGAVTTAPFVVRIGSAILRGSPWGDGSTALAVKMISAVFFVLAGLSVARMSERARTLRGGVG